MKKSFLLFACLIFLCAGTFGQGIGREENTFYFPYADGEVRIEFCTPDLFRIRKSRSSEFAPNEHWMVVKYDWSPVDVHLSEQPDHYRLRTSRLDVRVYKYTFFIHVHDRNGILLYAELPEPKFDGDSVINRVTLSPDEHFFGFGERMDFMDQRGKKVELNVGLGRGPRPAVGGKDILRANYCPVPWFMSNRGYGIFFHTSFATTWDMGWTNHSEYSFKSLGHELDYYFFYGPDFYTMLDRYTDLTGKSPLIPRFAFGLHLGTYSGGTWNNEQHTSDTYPVELARKMRKNRLPFDILWLDSTWRYFNLDGFRNGGASFEWRETFTDPKGMFDSLYNLNVAMAGLHVRSIIDNGTRLRLYDEAKAKGYTYPYAQSDGLIDFFNPEAVDWWWDNAAMKVVDLGAKFFKTDVGSVMRLHPEAPAEAAREVDSLHNIFPLAYAEAPFNKFRQHNDMRGFTHTREGYAGIQRYPFIWAGDWGTEWQWFEAVVRGGLNIGMSGVGFWSHCMGGFEQYSAYDTELYTRWVQFGMFSPIALLFGMDHPRYHEPWTYGEEAMNNFRMYDSIRYTLIPYIYSTAYQVHRSGRPMMTPLLMDHQNDVNTYDITDQYMFGPAMMICPVTVKNALSRPVYFPGGDWFDHWTGERISGRQYKSFLTPLDTIPVFIKAGAIIPQQPAMQYLGEKPVETITFDIYPHGVSSFDMYEDDGLSRDYERGIHSMTNIASDLTPTRWTLNIQKPAGNYTPPRHRYLVKSLLETAPVSVIENNSELPRKYSIEAIQNTDDRGWYYDPRTKRLWIKPSAGNTENITIVATF